MRRCCLIHLKNSSTLHRLRYNSAIVSAEAVRFVSQEDVSGTILRVDADHFPQFLGVILRAFINREVADGIRDYVRRKPPFPCLRVEPDIGFRHDDEEHANAVDGVEIAEIIVAAVKDIMGTVLIRNLRHSL